MITIPPIQEKILRQLADYKFLTVEQLKRLLKVNHKNSIYQPVQILSEKGFVEALIYGAVSRVGTSQKLHFLTAKGAKIVGSFPEIDKIRYPKSHSTMVKNDFYHRIHTVDTQISFYSWVEENNFIASFFDVYFDTIGSQKGQGINSRSITRIDFNGNVYIVPDSIFCFDTPQEKNLCVLEIANGRDTGRVLKQIDKNLEAIYNGLVSDKYQIKKSPTLLIAFEHIEHQKGVMKAVKEGVLMKKFEDLPTSLFFGLQENIRTDWAKSWVNINGENAEWWH
jgi:hypothetical protein